MSISWPRSCAHPQSACFCFTRARVPDRVERRKDAHVLAPDRLDPRGSGVVQPNQRRRPNHHPEIGFPARTGASVAFEAGRLAEPKKTIRRGKIRVWVTVAVTSRRFSCLSHGGAINWTLAPPSVQVVAVFP